jgi:cell division protein YceG involved in septum cleavage
MSAEKFMPVLLYFIKILIVLKCIKHRIIWKYTEYNSCLQISNKSSYPQRFCIPTDQILSEKLSITCLNESIHDSKKFLHIVFKIN